MRRDSGKHVFVGGGTPGASGVAAFLLRSVVAALAFTVSCAAAGDDYLQVLDAEAGKIDAASAAANAAQDSARVPSAPDSTRDQFETVLQEQYRGTFVFYQQLAPNIQEELFAEYRNGTAMAELRDKIVSRYLQR